MTDSEAKEIQVKPKQEVTSPAEQTQPGVVFTPGVDIFETERELTLLADLPGVTAENLTIDLRENTLTLTGEVAPFETANEQDILIEYEIGKYYRQFSLSNVIDQSKIDAKLVDGVLRLTLPKVEEAKPRKIEVRT
ncbi:MAG: Hsp20/alpha crystallin family protein [Deltaproteobacteria bacterium]|jgi:HSP20 family molecular chaperone IbpA|nr:Hsp20/alpha crystallin family protein [Deltaproteobacteria bacterium]